MNQPHNRTSLSRSEIVDMVIASLQEVLTTMKGDAPSTTLGEDTYLIGSEAALDSLGLVNLILEIEQRLEQEHGVTVILADERAMSKKNSPFRSVRSLTDYLGRLIEEQDARVGG